jgi:uncharacterized protein YlxP (DUF503 family)
MIVGVLTVELALLEAQTLKDKRRVILSLKQRLMNRFNVSVAEVGYPNSAKRCRLGVAVVAGDSRGAHSQLDQLVDVIRRTMGLTLIDYERRLC